MSEVTLAPEQTEADCFKQPDPKSCHCIVRFYDGVLGKPGPNNKVKKGAAFCIEPSGYTEPEKLQFTYEFGDFKDNSIPLSVHFADPDNVSIAADADMLIIELKDFRDNEGNLIVEEKIIRIPIPNQVSSDLASTIKAAGSFASSGVASTFSFNFVLSILLSTSMN